MIVPPGEAFPVTVSMGDAASPRVNVCAVITSPIITARRIATVLTIVRILDRLEREDCPGVYGIINGG